MDTRTALAGLFDEMGLPAHARGRVSISGDEQTCISPHMLGSASAVALGAQGAAVAELWRLRTGESQDVTVERERAAQALLTSAHTRREGDDTPPALTKPFGWCYPTRDGRFILMLLGSQRPHQLARTLTVLGVDSVEAIGDTIKRWNGPELEEAVYAAGAVAGLVRTPEQWRAHPQGQWLAARPMIEIDKIADGAPVPLDEGDQPLSGIRVLDCTHVIAGPVIGRTLAEQGPEVLHISRPVNYDTESFIINYGIGKRNATVDLDSEDGRRRVADLARDADIFIQSYRPGALAARGLSPEALAAGHRGLVYVTVSCFGLGGPIGHRRGVDPIAQAVSGICHTDRRPDGVPEMSRIVTLTDPLAGYLGAAGALAGLLKRTTNGGSYHVRISLVRAAMWLQDFGLGEGCAIDGIPTTFPDLGTPAMFSMATPYGRMRYMAPVTQYSKTPGRWTRPPEPSGTSTAAWA